MKSVVEEPEAIEAWRGGLGSFNPMQGWVEAEKVANKLEFIN